MQNLSPEERARMMERMRARGFDATALEGTGRSGRMRGESGQPAAAQAPSRSARSNPQATTIDALFGPLPVIETRGRVWLYAGNQLNPMTVRLGITDGQATELIEGGLDEGTEVVTNVITGTEATRPTPGGPGFPPFMGGRGGFDRGGRGGGSQGGGR
jgi:hypothetical protein